MDPFLWSTLQIIVCCAVLSHFSRAQLFVTLWTVAHQTPLSMGFSRHEYWLLCPPLGHLPNPGIKPTSLSSSALADGVFTISTTREGHKTGLARPRFLKVTSYFRFETYQKNLNLAVILFKIQKYRLKAVYKEEKNYMCF